MKPKLKEVTTKQLLNRKKIQLKSNNSNTLIISKASPYPLVKPRISQTTRVPRIYQIKPLELLINRSSIKEKKKTKFSNQCRNPKKELIQTQFRINILLQRLENNLKIQISIFVQIDKKT